MLSFLKRTKIS